MAEIWRVAFGRYLRTLRERRDLSLQEVCSLSQAFTETLNKGYLSRCENGRQSPAFSKIIPLARIYCVPAEVLLERLELDMELDQAGGAETADKDFAELFCEATDALTHGFYWNAYALFRDALPLAGSASVVGRYENSAEQTDCAVMNCATAARTLGRTRYALHEFLHLESRGRLGPRYQFIVLERLSVLHRSLNQPARAVSYAQRAIEEAEKLGEPERLGYAYSNRALIAFASDDPETAAELFQKAYDHFKAANLPHHRVRTMNNLAQVLLDLGRLRASRRMLEAAAKLANDLGQERSLALNRILMGEIDSREHRAEQATRLWREAAETGKRLNDKILRFKAEFQLFKQAREQGNQPVARALQRRLRRLSNWVPRETYELTAFRSLAMEPGPRRLRSVSAYWNHRRKTGTGL